MRYIPRHELEAIQLPEDWDEKRGEAESAVLAYQNALSRDRNQVIGRYATNTWRALKDVLSRLNYGKCWYCDCKQIRSHNAIDHFRPRGAVRENPSHPGYWWIAFNPSNFRYCCTYCNSQITDSETGFVGGKHDQFPLFDENTRALPCADCSAEDPVLLDPTNASDIGLITWDIDGKAQSRYSAAAWPRNFRRATDSILVYNLRHSELVKFLRVAFNFIKTRVRDGDLYFLKAVSGATLAERTLAERALGDVKNDLLVRIRDEADCSQAVRGFLGEFRNPATRPWLEAIL